MVEYKIVKFCRICRKRFVVQKGESKRNCCDDCQPKPIEGEELQKI